MTSAICFALMPMNEELVTEFANSFIWARTSGSMGIYGLVTQYFIAEMMLYDE